MRTIRFGANKAPCTWHPRGRYGQVAAIIFTDATSSVRMLLELLPAVVVAGGAVVAPGVEPDAALAAAALPVTAMRWPT